MIDYKLFSHKSTIFSSLLTVVHIKIVAQKLCPHIFSLKMIVLVSNTNYFSIVFFFFFFIGFQLVLDKQLRSLEREGEREREKKKEKKKRKKHWPMNNSRPSYNKILAMLLKGYTTLSTRHWPNIPCPLSQLSNP